MLKENVTFEQFMTGNENIEESQSWYKPYTAQQPIVYGKCFTSLDPVFWV